MCSGGIYTARWLRLFSVYSTSYWACCRPALLPIYPEGRGGMPGLRSVLSEGWPTSAAWWRLRPFSRSYRTGPCSPAFSAPGHPWRYPWSSFWCCSGWFAPSPDEFVTKERNAPVDDKASAIDIDQFHRGDQSCFQRVLEKFSPLIQSVVSSQLARYPQDRDDVYQEICMRIWERRTQYSGRGSLAGWINRIAHHTCLNWRRQRRRHDSGKERYAPEAVAAGESSRRIADPAQLLGRKEFMDRLRQSVAALSERQADVFILVRLKGCTVKEAADVLKVKTTTVRSNLRHATKRLRRELKEFKNGLS